VIDDPRHPLPNTNTLQELIIKCNMKQPFNDVDREWVRNVLIALSQDQLYKLRERVKKYEADEHDRAGHR
jgi:hypothetical protein